MKQIINRKPKDYYKIYITMASGDLLKKLFKSYKQLDDEGFYTAALEIINQEKQKNHSVLARDLQRIIENGNSGSKPVSSAHYADLQRLPRDREKGTLLFELRTTDKYRVCWRSH